MTERAIDKAMAVFMYWKSSSSPVQMANPIALGSSASIELTALFAEAMEAWRPTPSRRIDLFGNRPRADSLQQAHAQPDVLVKAPDRAAAAQLYERGVPLTAVENAFVLAATRRLIRPAAAPPLGTIRSLAYFLPVIEEVLSLTVHPAYFDYLRHRLAALPARPRRG